jgi:hypothetical protein
VSVHASPVTPAAGEEPAAASRLAGWLERIAALPAEQRAGLARALNSAVRGGQAVPRLVAYVVPAGPASVSPARLRAFLAERLPPAFLPAHFLVLPVLPLLPSGKLDRSGLPPPGAGRQDLSQPYAPPRDEVEQSVCQILAEVLGLPSVGLHDEFWELGGDSQAAARLAHRIRREFGVDLGMRQVFEEPTAALLAACVRRARPAHGADALVPLAAGHRKEQPPLSSAQLRHWFLQQVDPASPAYNTCDTLRLTGPVDLPALERAMSAVIERHEILRTRFPVVDGEPTQAVSPPGSFSLAVADLREMSGPDGERVATELIAGDRSRPFDLGRLPLLRLRLIRLTDAESLLSVTAHHIVADDWAFGVLYDDLSALYDAALDGRPSPLPPLDVQYADYCAWEQRMLSSRLAAGLDYWRDQLLTAPGLAVPGGAGGTVHGAVGWHRFVLPEALTGRLATWCRLRSVTLFVACLAAYAEVLGRRAGQDEVVVGVPFANRERLELERMIGCFINPVALRIDRRGAPSLPELIARVDSVVRPGYAMQFVPYEKVTDAVRLARVRDGLPGAAAPLFDAVLNFVPRSVPPRLRGVRVTPADDLPPSYGARSLLTLYLEDNGRTVLGRMAYATGHLSGEVATALADDFVAAIGGLFNDCP